MLPGEQAQAFGVMLLTGAGVTAGVQLAAGVLRMIAGMGRKRAQTPQRLLTADFLTGPLAAAAMTAEGLRLRISVWRWYTVAACALGMGGVLGVLAWAERLTAGWRKKRRKNRDFSGSRQEKDGL